MSFTHRSGAFNINCSKRHNSRAPFKPINGTRKLQNAVEVVAFAQTAIAALPEDKWIAQSMVQFQDVSIPNCLKGLRDENWHALASLRMPTTRNEEYRFTDISPLLKCTLQAGDSKAHVDADFVERHVLSDTATVVIVNGTMRADLSRLERLEGGVFCGSAADAPSHTLEHMGTLSGSSGGPFSVLNAVAARDAVVIAVPAGMKVSTPIHLLCISTGPSGTSNSAVRSLSAPRVLVVLGEGSSLEVVEEFVGMESADYATLSVLEAVLAKKSSLSQAYVQTELGTAFHFHSTLLQQAESSSYSLVEFHSGGSLSRHDVDVKQVGADTETTMRHFLLCGNSQLHDLHTRLTLDHPRGKAQQLHKAIVTAASGRGIFDGNVAVNKLAQETDASQLSRNLLLVPRATVNVKPNLQIVADNVKCTHGCTVSDLSDEELFYFRARGISPEVARLALISSFGVEVIRQLSHPQLRARVGASVKRAVEEAGLVTALLQ